MPDTCHIVKIQTLLLKRIGRHGELDFEGPLQDSDMMVVV